MAYNTRDMNDIHQSNNVSNATQERLQENNEEPEMRDNSCQTRESLFEPRISDSIIPVGFTTFGVRGPGSQNGTNHLHHHRHHHLHHHQSPTQSRQSGQSSQHSMQQSSEHSSQQPGSQCSGCSPASRGRDGSMGICPKHNPIPAPPGWSTHESSYPLPLHQGSSYPEHPDYPSYQRFQSPKPSRENSVYRQSPKLLRQGTTGSGERYGSSVYGSGHGSSNTSSTQHSGTPKCSQQTTSDARYRAEAVIEVDQRRPFSIESTKSAPDVIATHWRRGPGDWEPYKRRHPRQTVADLQLPSRNDGNKVTVATQSSLDDDASTSSTIEANSSSWSTYTGAIDRPGQLDRAISDDSNLSLDKTTQDVLRTAETPRSLSTGKQNDVPFPRSVEIGKIKEPETRLGNIGEIGGIDLNDTSVSESIETNTRTSRGDVAILQSTGRDEMQSMDGVPVSKVSSARLALKLNDLPILRPPEAFRAPIFRCKTPTLAWQHCGCPSHSHLPPRRSSVIWSALKHYSQEPFYRTWPNRTSRRFVRPSRRTVGTQSSLDGSRSSLSALRCVVRSIDMTERSMDLEIGATIPF